MRRHPAGFRQTTATFCALFSNRTLPCSNGSRRPAASLSRVVLPPPKGLITSIFCLLAKKKTNIQEPLSPRGEAKKWTFQKQRSSQSCSAGVLIFQSSLQFPWKNLRSRSIGSESDNWQEVAGRFQGRFLGIGFENHQFFFSSSLLLLGRAREGELAASRWVHSLPFSGQVVASGPGHGKNRS